MTDTTNPCGEGAGYCMVPFEPTEEMLNEAQEEFPRSARYAFGKIWEAMLRARPPFADYDYGAFDPTQQAAKTGEGDLEEAVRLCEVGEYLYDAKSYSHGDGYSEPREFGIAWDWQQSKPDEYGQGVLLAEANRWHDDMAADGAVTQARKLRAALTDPRALTAGEAVAPHCQLCGGRVEGWFCQTCEAEFHEEGGLLVLKSEASPQPARMPTREEVEVLLNRVYGMGARNETLMLSGEADKLLDLFTPSAGVDPMGEADELRRTLADVVAQVKGSRFGYWQGGDGYLDDKEVWERAQRLAAPKPGEA